MECNRPHHHIRISAGIRLRSRMVGTILALNSMATPTSFRVSPLSLDEISTDASSSYGYGAFLMGGYFSLSFAAS